MKLFEADPQAFGLFIHVSDLSTEHVAAAGDVVHVGDRVKVRVVGIEPERRRLSLSIRQAAR